MFKFSLLALLVVYSATSYCNTDNRIGRFVNTTKNTYCTAFLIGSNDIAITARHCWDNKPSQNTFKIYWGMSSNTNYYFLTPEWGWTRAIFIGNKTFAEDWVAFKLKEKVPTGWFGWRTWGIDNRWEAGRFPWKKAILKGYGSSHKYSQKETSVTWSFTSSPGLYPAIISKERAGEAGSSGAPLLYEEGYIIGSANGNIENMPYKYRFTRTQEFIGAINSLR